MKIICKLHHFLLIAAGCIFTFCTEETADIAKNKIAVASSNYDYNLTAQLATDGIITAEEPCFLSVFTKEGELPKREKEWALDSSPHSCNILNGEENFLEYRWSRQSFCPKSIRVTGLVAYNPSESHRWSIVCSVNDTIKGSVHGNALPGKARKPFRITDPNKDTGTLKYPARSFTFDIPLTTETPFSQLKISFAMENAVCWKIRSIDFPDREILLPSQCFTSAWMSADANPQWIQVDLGGKMKINGICLHWIHKPQNCKAEISNDGRNWSDLTTFPQNSELKAEVKVEAKARYVRLNMDGADESGHFCLSEIVITGKPGKGDRSQWLLQRASLVSDNGETISKEGYHTDGWLPAIVPGTVLYSYIAAGAVPDITLSDNNRQVSESFFNSDFWYRAEIQPQKSKGDRHLLIFDGINWKALVYMNGSYVGRIDGAFKQEVFDVTDLVGDKNIVAVRVVKNAHYGAVKEKNSESPDFNGGALGADNPTFHASVGWDWIPTVRGREIGIWNDVHLVRSKDVRLSHPLVQSHINADGSAEITATVELTNLSDKSVSGTLRGSIGKVKFGKEIDIDAHSTIAATFSPAEFNSLHNCRLALWWPNGMGDANLHDAWYSFDDGEKLEYKAGIREFTYSDTMSDLKMYVNGHRFFPKGGNWGFSEVNLRYGAKEYDKAVGYHKEMNLNMIRNWVGQTGDDEFYQACDKYGIVVWQDFWLANPGDGPDPDDEEMFADNARDYLRRIRSHASIGLYCGRNEGYPPASLDEVLSQTVKSLHSDIVYIPNSAEDGVSGHGPYRAVSPDEYFAMPVKKFHSERGMPYVMSYSSLQRTFTEENIWPIGDVWGQHDFTRTGAQGDETFVRMLREGFGAEVTDSPEKFAKYAQWISYDGYRAMYEANNAGKKGLLIWMSHSCWPSLAWQTYDYWFDRGGAFYGTKKGNEHLHIQYNPAERAVQVCNYRTTPADNLTATISIAGPDGNKTYSKKAELSVGEYEIKNVIDCSDIPDGPSVVTLILKNAKGAIVSDNIYIRNFKDGKNTGIYTGIPRETIDAILEKVLSDE